MRIVVVGGVAGGMSAAARARRLDENAEIVVLERGDYVSFANCGLPYHVGGEIADRASLLLQTPASLHAALNLDVRTGHEVARGRPGRPAGHRPPPRDGTDVIDYDALVLAPGAAAIRPPIGGLDLPQVHTLRTRPGRRRAPRAARPTPRTAPSSSAPGFIGLEAAEALRERGLDVDLVDLAPHVLPPLDTELASLLDDELTAHGVRTHVGVAAEAIRPDPGRGPRRRGRALRRHRAGRPTSSCSPWACAPTATSPPAPGLELHPSGAIVVDTAQRTSDPHIWAVGDATAVRHGVTGALGPVPLAGPPTGRAAAPPTRSSAGSPRRRGPTRARHRRRPRVRPHRRRDRGEPGAAAQRGRHRAPRGPPAPRPPRRATSPAPSRCT